MIKYIPEDTAVCFAELPDEVALGINLSCCPHQCIGCHSKYLQTDCGKELTRKVVDSLISTHSGITCVLFLGGDANKAALIDLSIYIRNSYNLLTGWYSGESSLDLNYYGRYFDYIKIGPYIKDLGPLRSRTTNQRLYFIERNKHPVDITDSFWHVR